MTTIKNIILDYGLVLCRAPNPATIDQISAMFGIMSNAFWPLYEKNRGIYDRGELTGTEYWERFAEDTNTKLEERQIKWLRQCDIEMWSELDSRIFAWVDALRIAKYKTCILSNLNKEFASHMRRNNDWIRKFTFQVFSAEFGRIKPEPEIYRHCLELLECLPDEALFIDDREANLVAARKEGIVSLLFRSIEQLRTDLHELDFPVLPARD